MEDRTDSADANQFAIVELECETLLEQFPDLFRDVDLSVPDAIPAACEHLRRRGFTRAFDEEWVLANFKRAVLIVMCRAGTLHRLIELLNAEGDFENAISLAKRKGCDDSTAHDAVEDAVYRVVRRGHGLREKESLKRYFRTILFETICDAVERMERRRKMETPLAVANAEPTVSQPLFTTEEIRNTLLDAIQASDLPPKAVAALYLKYGAEWAAADIGSALQMPPATVNVWNFRSAEKLRERLGPDRPNLQLIAASAPSSDAGHDTKIAAMGNKQTQAVATLAVRFNMPSDLIASACGLTSDAVEAIKLSILAGKSAEQRHEK